MKRKILILLSFLLLLLSLTAAIFHTPAVRRIILKQSLKMINENGKILVKAETLDYNLLFLDFEINNISLTGNMVDRPFVNASKVKLSLPWSTLFNNKLFISKLTVTEPSVRIYVDKEGLTNLPQMSGEIDRPGKFPEYRIDKLSILRGSIELSNEEDSFAVSTGVIASELAWEREGVHGLMLEMTDEGQIKAGNNLFPVTILNSTATVEKNGIDLESLNLGAGKSKVEVKGEIKDTGFNIEVDSELNIEDISAVAGAGEHFKGNVNILGQFEGTPDDIAFRMDGGTTEGNPDSSPDLRISTEGRWKEGLVSFENTTLEFDGIKMNGSGKLYPFLPEETSRLNASIEQFSLDILQKHFPIPYRMNSNASAEFEIAWKSNIFESLNGAAQIRLSPGKNSFRTEYPISLSGDLTIKLENGCFEFESENINFKEGGLRTAFNLKTNPLSGNIKLESDGIENSLQYLEPYLKDFKMADISGPVRCDAVISGTMDLPLIVADVHSNSLSLYGMKEMKLEGSLNYSNNSFEIKQLVLAKGDGKLEGHGSYHQKSKSYNGEINFSSLNLEKLKLNDPGEEISGVLNGMVEISGTTSNIGLKSDISFKDALFGALSPGDIFFISSTENGRIKFHLSAPDLNAEADGYVLNEKNFPLKSSVSLRDFTMDDFRELGIYNAPTDFDGSVTVSADIGFNLNDPTGTIMIDAVCDHLSFNPGEIEMNNSSPFRLHFENNLLEVRDFKMEGPGSFVLAAGSIPLKGDEGEGLEIFSEFELQTLNGFSREIDATGSAIAELSISGSMLSPHLSGRAVISDGEIAVGALPATYSSVNIESEFSESGIEVVRSDFKWNGSSWNAKGSIPWSAIGIRERKGSELALDFQFDKLGVSALRPLFGKGNLDKLTGECSGTLFVGGESFLFEDLKADLQFSRLQFSVSGVDLVQTEPSRILLDREKLLIKTVNMEGKESYLRTAGYFHISEEGEVNLSMIGKINLGVLGLFLDTGVYGGTADFDINISGNMPNPEFEGFARLENASLRLTEPALYLSKVKGGIDLKEHRIVFSGLKGSVNGGSLTLEGFLNLSDRPGMELLFNGKGAQFNYPGGFRTESDFNLKFVSDMTESLLSGEVKILRGAYKERINLQSEAVNYVLTPTAVELFEEKDSFLEGLEYRVKVNTVQPFLLDNNLAKSEVTADIMLLGDYYYPVISGRAAVVEGGQVFFNKTSYTIDSGVLDFIDPSGINPYMDITGWTKKNGYRIHLRITGTLDKINASFSSDPPLSEPEILSLLMTGKTPDSLSGGGDMGRDQAIAYLFGDLTDTIGHHVSQKLGIETVRIEPILVSSEENPGGRLTLGQHLTSDIELVYSQGLTDAENQTWIVNYNSFRKFNLRGVSRDNGEYSAGLEHQIDFGGVGSSAFENDSFLKKENIVRSVEIKGTPHFPYKKLRNIMKVKEKRRFDFFSYQEDTDRLRDFYRRNDFLDVSIETERKEEDGFVDLIFRIEAGGPIILNYSGDSIPRKLKKAAKKTWMDGIYGPQIIQDIKNLVLKHFFRKKYYAAEITIEENPGISEGREFLLTLNRNRKYKKPELTFSGADPLNDKELLNFIKNENIIESIFLNDRNVVDPLRRFYMMKGYLKAEVKDPEISMNPEEKKASVHFEVNVGPLFRIGEMTTVGGSFFSEADMLSITGLNQGETFYPSDLDSGIRSIENAFSKEGFNDVKIKCQPAVSEEDGLVDLLFSVKEGDRQIIDDIKIEGYGITKLRYIEREIEFKGGEPVDYRKINKTRKALYDLGIFESVAVEIEEEKKRVSSPDDDSPAYGVVPVDIKINVNENNLYRLRYGLEYDTETRFGGNIEIVRRNLFGRAMLAGTGARINSLERDFRGWLSSPYFFGEKLKTNLFIYSNHNTETAYDIDKKGLTFQQQYKFNNPWLWSYNYTYEKVRANDSLGYDITTTLGKLNNSLSYDSRDDFMDASKGIFFSNSLGYASSEFGSDSTFVRYFGQFNSYRNIGKSIIWASSFRIGLAEDSGNGLPPSERFFAGGSSSVRGFRRNYLGPKDPLTGEPFGGNSLFIMNQELRFPVYSFLSGAVFYDMGNIYPDISDFDPSDVRQGAGLGIRVKTPVLLMRLDLAWKLDRKEGESPSRIYFSIGQTF